MLPVAGHLIQVRRHAVLLDGRVLTLSPAPMAILQELAREPGAVRSRAELGAALPGPRGSDGHAVEMAVGRLRTTLEAQLIQTVVKRGYRLAYPTM